MIYSGIVRLLSQISPGSRLNRFNLTFFLLCFFLCVWSFSMAEFYYKRRSPEVFSGKLNALEIHAEEKLGTFIKT